MALPRFLKPCFPSYDLKSLDLKKDRDLIITEILNKGDERMLSWVGKNYSVKEVKQVVSSPSKGMWMKSILSYWLKIFNLELDKKIFDKAVIDLNKF